MSEISQSQSDSEIHSGDTLRLKDFFCLKKKSGKLLIAILSILENKFLRLSS